MSARFRVHFACGAAVEVAANAPEEAVKAARLVRPDAAPKVLKVKRVRG